MLVLCCLRTLYVIKVEHARSPVLGMPIAFGSPLPLLIILGGLIAAAVRAVSRFRARRASVAQLGTASKDWPVDFVGVIGSVTMHPSERGSLAPVMLALAVSMILMRLVNSGARRDMPLEQRWPLYSLWQKLGVLTAIALSAVAVWWFFRSFGTRPTL